MACKCTWPRHRHCVRCARSTAPHPACWRLSIPPPMPMPPPTALLPLSARNQLSHAQRWLCGSACTSHVQFSHGLGIETIIERAAAVIEYCKAQNVEIRHAMASVVWRCCMPSHLCPLLRTAAAAWCMVHVVASACCLVHPSDPLLVCACWMLRPAAVRLRGACSVFSLAVVC